MRLARGADGREEGRNQFEKYTGEYMQGHRNPAMNNSPLPALGYIRPPLSWKGFKNPEQ